MAQDEREGGSKPLAAETGPELRPCDSEASEAAWTVMSPDEPVYWVECANVASLTGPIGVREDGFTMEVTVCAEHGPEWLRP